MGSEMCIRDRAGAKREAVKRIPGSVASAHPKYIEVRAIFGFVSCIIVVGRGARAAAAAVALSNVVPGNYDTRTYWRYQRYFMYY